MATSKTEVDFCKNFAAFFKSQKSDFCTNWLSFSANENGASTEDIYQIWSKSGDWFFRYHAN